MGTGQPFRELEPEDEVLFHTERSAEHPMPWVRWVALASALLFLGPMPWVGFGPWVALFVCFGPVTAVPLCLWLWGLHQHARRSQQSALGVEVHRSFLLVLEPRGVRRVPFSSIKTFWRDQREDNAGFRERVTLLLLEEGEPVVLTDRLAHYDALCVQLARGLAPVLFPRVFEELDLGHVVRLGGLSVTSQALQWTQGPLAWESLLGYELERNPLGTSSGRVRLRFATTSGVVEAPVDSTLIPDVGLFLAVVERYGPRRVRVDLVQARAQEAQESERAQPQQRKGGGATTP